MVDDESEPYNPVHYYLTEAAATLRTDGYLIKEDPSLKTFWNFAMGRDYLNSKWTDQLHQEERLHIIYLAVRPRMQHHGISALLLNEAIDYADRHRQMISLETHNEKNVAFYQHFGFKVFGVVEKHFDRWSNPLIHVIRQGLCKCKAQFPIKCKRRFVVPGHLKQDAADREVLRLRPG